MSGQNGYEQFVNGDEGYLLWLTDHPFRFVVNSQRVPTSKYLILHRASCRHISTENRTNWTTTGFIKTCATSVPPLMIESHRLFDPKGGR